MGLSWSPTWDIEVTYSLVASFESHFLTIIYITSGLLAGLDLLQLRRYRVF
jgi:hypothetical protein